MDEDEIEVDHQICNKILLVWINIMCWVHWINFLAIPITMLWPYLFPSPSKTLWMIEFAFLLDIVRKCVDKKPKSLAVDNYDIFVEYLKSNLILDLFATMPNLFSGMGGDFTFFKMIRFYEIDMLQYSLAALMRWTL